MDKVLETDYVDFTFEFDDFNEEVDSVDVENDDCMVVTSNRDGAIEVLDDEVEELFVCSDATVFYQDNSGDWIEADITDVSLVNDDAKVTLTLSGSDLVLVNANDWDITLNADWANEQFGSEENEAEATDFLLDGDSIGEKEYDILTPFGTVIPVPQDQADADEFTFYLPTDKVEVELFVY